MSALSSKVRSHTSAMGRFASDFPGKPRNFASAGLAGPFPGRPEPVDMGLAALDPPRDFTFFTSKPLPL